MEVVSYHNWRDFVYIDSWGFVVWDFKKTNRRYCIAELTFIFGECYKASDNIWTFPREPVPDTYIWKKKQRHSLPVHSFTMLPLHRNDRMELKRRSSYATEIADFYRMQIVAKKIWVRGKTGGSVGFPETRHFFFLWPNCWCRDIPPSVWRCNETPMEILHLVT